MVLKTLFAIGIVGMLAILVFDRKHSFRTLLQSVGNWCSIDSASFEKKARSLRSRMTRLYHRFAKYGWKIMRKSYRYLHKKTARVTKHTKRYLRKKLFKKKDTVFQDNSFIKQMKEHE